MIIALNNKSNLNKEEFLNYQKLLGEVTSTSTIICCPTLLNINLFNLSNVYLGSQNVSRYQNGAYTGEVSATALKASNVKYSIVGHSERRGYQKETLEDIHEKIKRLFEVDIIPILCIGETKEERDNNQVEEILRKELVTAIAELTPEERARMIVAYEPIWSIGTGIIPTNDEIRNTLNFIKSIVPDSKILYGGSANDENITTLKEIKEIDGYLLGGLSLKPDKLQHFINILEN